MGKEDFSQRSKKLHLSALIKNCKPFLNISKIHHLEFYNNEVVGHTTSSAAEENTNSTKKSLNIQVDNWVVVKYDNSYFPGNVTKIENGEFKVDVMMKDGKFWKWPEIKDEIYYTKDKLVRKVNPQSVVNSRGYFKFDCDL